MLTPPLLTWPLSIAAARGRLRFVIGRSQSSITHLRPYGALFSSLGCAYSTLIVYSARILEEFHLIRLRFITHLKIHFSGFHSYYLYIKHKVHPGRFTPPRQGGGTSLHDRLPCIWISPLSRIRLRNLYRTHRFAVYALIGFTLSICFSGTVGTRFLYHTSKMVMFLQYNRRTLF